MRGFILIILILALIVFLAVYIIVATSEEMIERQRIIDD